MLKNYPINYIYVFSDTFEIDNLYIPLDQNYRIVGFTDEQSPFTVSKMIGDFGYKYSHKFKQNETLFFSTNAKDGNLDLQFSLKEITLDAEYLSTIFPMECEL